MMPAGQAQTIDPVIGAPGTVNKQGYLRTWTQTPDASGPPGSVESYCYQSLPARPGQTGVRSFGGDSSGSLVHNNAAAACCTAAGLLSPGCAALK